MNYYQLYPSDEHVIQTLATVIKFYGWSQISIITEVENKLLEVIKYISMYCVNIQVYKIKLSIPCYVIYSSIIYNGSNVS